MTTTTRAIPTGCTWGVAAYGPTGDDFARRGHHALGDHVALHDAAEDVDENPFNIWIGGDDLERRGHLFLRGTAADIEKVGRRHAVQLDDVHGGHRKTRAIDHAADRAVERDVIKIVFRSLDFLVVFLSQVTQRDNIRMAMRLATTVQF